MRSKVFQESAISLNVTKIESTRKIILWLSYFSFEVEKNGETKNEYKNYETIINRVKKGK